jgi:Protein of unknown function (DUF1153)
MSIPGTQPINEYRDVGDERAPMKAKSGDAITVAHGYADLVLPSAETKRWSSRRKAAVIVAMRTGVITREQACERYLLSEEELTGWETAFDKRGIRGLLVTRRRDYRPAMPVKP